MRGAAATGHASTTDAAIQVLEAGGNAIDATVAAALAAGVCEPLLMGFGGGVMLTIRDGSTGQVHVLDSFSPYPGLGVGLKPRHFLALEVDYGPTTQIFHAGRGSAAVPTVAVGLETFWERWGSLPLARITAPAIRLAREGWVATHGTEVVSTMLSAITAQGPRSNALFNPDGRPLAEGARVRVPALADALEDFAAEGSAPFRSGKHAQALLNEFGPPNGSLTERDLTEFRPQLLEPLEVPYHGATLYVPPPPCTGGALLAFGLGVLDRAWDPGGDDVEMARCFAEVMAATERARAEGFDEGMFDPGAVEELLSEKNLEHHARTTRAHMDRSRRGGAGSTGSVPPVGKVPGNTTHISVVDEAGNAVALTSSNGETCGFLWPGLEMVMNNFLGEDDIHPFGFHNGPAGGRFRTMMTPALMVEEDGGFMAMGTGGSNRIRTAMLQVVRHLVDGQEGLEAAIMEPRIHVEGGQVQLEDLSQGTEWLDAVSGGGHRKVSRFEDRHLYFGGVHTAARRGDGEFQAVGDPRRAGHGRVTD